MNLFLTLLLLATQLDAVEFACTRPDAAAAWFQDLKFVDRSTQLCFYATAPVDEVVTCHLGAAGLYPPGSAPYDTFGCCFDRALLHDTATDAVFWALGESHMSEVTRMKLDPNAERATEEGVQPEWLSDENWAKLRAFRARLLGGARYAFDLKDAVLVDLLVLNSDDDAPVQGVRVSVADASMHLVSYTRESDEDGYAVLPMIRGVNYTVTVRASGFVQPAPLQFAISTDETLETHEHIVELDRGVSLKGTVKTANGEHAGGAQLVVSVTNDAGNEIWDSTLDRPRPLSKTLRLSGDDATWMPERPSVSCDEKGRFKLENVPHGKIHVFAVADGFAPGDVVSLDAREESSFTSLDLNVAEPQMAWFRVINSQEERIPATLEIVDQKTGFALDPVQLDAVSSTKLSNLPKTFSLTIQSEGYWPLHQNVDLTKNSEWTFTLTPSATASLAGRVTDAQNTPLAGASLYGTSALDVACFGKTDSTGAFKLETCPLDGTTLHIEAAGYAPVDVKVTPQNETLIIMDHGVSLDLVLPRDALNVTCTLSRNSHSSTPTPLFLKSAENGHILFENLARAQYSVDCEANGAAPKHFVWTPKGNDTKFVERVEFTSLMTIKGSVIEKYSSDAPYAVVELNGVSVDCDESGRFEIALPQSDVIHVKARHWLYGQAELTRNTADTSEFVIRLDDLPPRGCQESLAHDGVKTVIDAASLLIDEFSPDSKWNGKGLKRGDYVESCRPNLVIVRNDRRMSF